MNVVAKEEIMAESCFRVQFSLVVGRIQDKIIGNADTVVNEQKMENTVQYDVPRILHLQEVSS